MMVWLLSLSLFLIWLVAMLAGKRGMIHILLLNVVGIAVIKLVAIRRTHM